MQDQKLENLLNLALSATPEEREKSGNLNVGYNPGEKSWDVIVKYSGDISGLAQAGIRVEPMVNEYAILTVPESLIDRLSELPQIEYVEKPKRLFFAINQAKSASCVNLVQQGSSILTGRGVLVAVIDSGIDYFHNDFRNNNGTTRIVKLWDQTLERVFTAEEINAALAAGNRAEARRLVPSTDISGHGTAVASIAAGNGRDGNGQYRGVAFESPLLVVKLGVPQESGFPRTTELMRAVNFAVQQAVELQMPLAINLSFGNTYGSHDGTSLLETFLDDISNYGKTVIVVGTGNEGVGGGHISGVLTMSRPEEIELSVGGYQQSFSVQLWKSYADLFDISIITPSGEVIGPISSRLGPQTINYRNTRILLYYGKPGPYSVAQEIYLDFLPIDTYIESGIWRFRLTPRQIVEGKYDLWLPSAGVLSQSTRFLRPTPETTLTIPSTASKVISVGAYDDTYQSYADFSGRGFTRRTNQVKPDISAPGVGIIAAKAGGGYETVTGTSFATPFVTGGSALLMQWGIVDGRDPFLFGEKIKAYLIRGARPLPGVTRYPNPELGYGALCISDSLPV
ncbi:S8 family peptidase [Lacrimispora saccharolytica]|uniref:Peptidase S8 and S53 subtilisin kexin sedolisin n=1 Tax=Lacrimispora saccharolytica (strain ATCC 35040 / DSM 2544 / NRCC 2533 / WM1) TaxID=610130 RepID=D9R2C2_LACSW|nr:S8 family peptidase [Lacrimispora saccharolytica]ADL04772.1 peptidase S8 and S53 subtilisin kexin sedolisin [[Clostridium] saccharolyticum WM1]QRV21010.1 S8 family serine peptidase [Lacrimispora saccharolytica]